MYFKCSPFITFKQFTIALIYVCPRRPVMKKLSMVQWCDPTVQEKLAAKYLELNGGQPKNLGKAEVRDPVPEESTGVWKTWLVNFT